MERFINKVIHGDCMGVLPSIPGSSIDSVVCDPPYELGFMGKAWDRSGIAYNVDVWRECLRVLKPGGHLLAFGGSRTYHRLACAVEDAGFEIRDQIMWVYGSGFPKSLDISKAIDKAAGAEREVVGVRKVSPSDLGQNSGWNHLDTSSGKYEYTSPSTDTARQWSGWGTALKPAHEPIVLARKPLIGTVAENVLEHGTGGINIDGCRVGCEGATKRSHQSGFQNEGVEGNVHGTRGYRTGHQTIDIPNTGRWPANFIHDGSEEVVRGFPDGAKPKPRREGKKGGSGFGFFDDEKTSGMNGVWPEDSGGSAARFFYCAKASREDREWGLNAFPKKPLNWSSGEKSPGTFQGEGTERDVKNFHPTVKPLALMRYLCRLVTPPGGIVLDPFAGSGSTCRAAFTEGLKFIGIELNEEYTRIANGRMNLLTAVLPF